VALIEGLNRRKLPYAIDVFGFSEEEGVRYGIPFIGSRAVVSGLDAEEVQLIGPALREFGLDPAGIPDALLSPDVAGYLELHIEQGPVLEHLNLPLGIATAIAGQSRFKVEFCGKANHAGTTPMHLRCDAVSCAAEWVLAVEEHALNTPGLVATVGRFQVDPGATNVIAGTVRASLDVRHESDDVRCRTVQKILQQAEAIATKRGLRAISELRLDQRAVAMDGPLTDLLEEAVRDAGFPAHRMVSGAGHDAMIMARRFPSALLFVRSPGGISHHPDETVYAADVEAALASGARFLQALESRYA
jgi:allantoate deiminase